MKFITQLLFTVSATFPHDFGTYIVDFVESSRGVVRLEDVEDSTYDLGLLEYHYTRGGTIGSCRGLGFAPFRIEIDEAYWTGPGNNFWDKWALMYHELGHCACSREHVDDEGLEWLASLMERREEVRVGLPDGCPTSLMNPSVPSAECAAAHHAYYVEEMFRNCRPVRHIRKPGYWF